MLITVRRNQLLAGSLVHFVVCVVLATASETALAADPATTPVDPFSAKERSHWAFQPIQRRTPPAVTHAELIQSPVDSFLLKSLEATGQSFSPPADRATLLRRLKFDLLGLPPTPAELDDFLADESPDAYEQLVDRFLASLHYGETWGRLWLDVVRFADTAGYNADPLRPLAWQYRDYVIRAFNEDVPYDRFLAEQLAGDELYPDDRNARIATGYLRMWPDESNASNILLARQDALNDMTGNLGAAVLGLSLACAQCHDHKFDPLPQRDYFTLQAFFAGITPADRSPVGKPEALNAYQKARQAWLDETEPLRRELQEIEAAARIPLTADRRIKFPAVVLEAIDTHPDRRTTMQRQLAFWSERQIDFKEADLIKRMSDEARARREELKKELAARKATAPKPPEEVAALTIAEFEDIPPTAVLSTGSYDRPEEKVSPGTLSVLLPAGASTDAPVSPSGVGSSGRRTALVQWLTNPKHPLTARVFVNRLWQEHFGRGLIENANDFGTQTPPPHHPELLDWLAAELMGDASAKASPDNRPTKTSFNSVKRLQRLIVTSTAYRQSSRHADANASGDEATAADDSLSAYPRRRLSAERVRDAMLAVSGELNPALTGPGVCPPLPAGYNGREAWKVSDSKRDQSRRSVYILAKRNLPFPILQAFDLPDMHESCACRSKTTTAPQALMLLNGEFVRTQSAAMARRLVEATGRDDRVALVEAAWTQVLGRRPESTETHATLDFFVRQERLAEADESLFEVSQASVAPASKSKPNESAPPAPAYAETGHEAFDAALTDICHALLNTSEFLFVE
jgi:hypothetical protein